MEEYIFHTIQQAICPFLEFEGRVGEGLGRIYSQYFNLLLYIPLYMYLFIWYATQVK